MVRLIDSKVEELIKRSLQSDSRIDLSEIHVRVEDGIAYLSGMVDSAAERRAARENLQSTQQIERIVDELQLRNYVERTDPELRESVRQALIRDIDVDIRPIKVEAQNGVVTLTGKVDSYSQKTAAENIAWWTPGVTEVIDRMELDGKIRPSFD
jgi:osmotically-inducible protein OsmY